MKARLLFLVVVGGSLAGALSGVLAPARSQNDAAQLPSPVIYPPQRIALRMDHSHPQHVRLRCERCHEGATESTRSAESLIPTEASCGPCHDAQTDREREEPACAYCHVGSDGTQITPSEFPPARIHFSHQRHAREKMHDVVRVSGGPSASGATSAQKGSYCTGKSGPLACISGCGVFPALAIIGEGCRRPRRLSRAKALTTSGSGPSN